MFTICNARALVVASELTAMTSPHDRASCCGDKQTTAKTAVNSNFIQRDNFTPNQLDIILKKT